MSTNSISPTESIQSVPSQTQQKPTMEYEKVPKKKPTLAPPITVWFNGNNGQMETHQITSSTEVTIEDDFVGQEQFFATGPYLGKSSFH